MRGLADQIAVLDGFDLSSISVGSGMTSRVNVVAPADGQNYSGGSTFAPGMPLLPSNAGLADADADLTNYLNQGGVLPAQSGVIDASGGANYSGGSSFAPGLPLLPSSAGLAGCASCGTDNDLMGFVARQNVVAPADGQNYTGGSTFAPGMPLLPSNSGLAEIPGVTVRMDVVTPADGQNYSGGSSFAPGMPLLPSNSGLAGLDAVKDARLGQKASPSVRPFLRTLLGARTVARLKKQAGRPGFGTQLRWAAMRAQRKLDIVRRARALVLASQGVYTREQLLNIVRAASAA